MREMSALSYRGMCAASRWVGRVGNGCIFRYGTPTRQRALALGWSQGPTRACAARPGRLTGCVRTTREEQRPGARAAGRAARDGVRR